MTEILEAKGPSEKMNQSSRSAELNTLGLKTREEYLIAFEEKVLGAVSGVFTSMDRNLIVSYSLSIALVLFNWEKATEFTFLGVKVAVSSEHIYRYLPLIVASIYLPISYQLYRITVIYRSIRGNAEELLQLNTKARPISLGDMRHFESGVAGLILALARWQASVLLTKNFFAAHDFNSKTKLLSLFMELFSLLYAVVNWSVKVIVSLATLLALFFLPLLICGYSVASRWSIAIWPPVDNLALFVFVCVALAAVATLWYGFVLFLVYFLDLLYAVKGDFEHSAKALLGSLVRLLTQRLIDNILRGPLFPFR